MSRKIADSVWRIGDNYPGRRTVTLMVTHDCNLNCTYCYEHHKSNKVMPVVLAKELIELELENVAKSDMFNELVIEFMGGEPLMNFQMIKEVVEWLESCQRQVPYVCYASTNGTLLSEERKDWFRLHKNTITLGVSYDGSPLMQQCNRGTKDDSIDLDFFHELWPDKAFHMVISKKSLPQFAEGVLYLQNGDCLIEAALAQGEKWKREDAVIYKMQLEMIMNAYLSDNSLIPMNKLTTFLTIDDALSNDPKMHKFCGAGTCITAYDVDGKKYGCHLFTPVVLGERAVVSDSIDWNGLSEPAQCIKCTLRKNCGTCLGYNYLQRGAPEKRDFSMCLMYLAELQVACEFQLRYFARKKILNATEIGFAKKALESYSVLRKFDVKTAKAPFVL